MCMCLQTYGGYIRIDLSLHAGHAQIIVDNNYTMIIKSGNELELVAMFVPCGVLCNILEEEINFKMAV